MHGASTGKGAVEMGRIHLKDVQKDFGPVTVIPPLNLEIEEGEFVVFVGPSGCGKSTLLRLIAGLEDVTGGTIEINGVDATDLPPGKRGLAMVFQSYAVWPHMTVYENIAFPLRIRKISGKEIDERVKRAMNMVGIGELSARLPSAISGGQQQRVAFARAIVYDPAVLLLDEPLSNLDAKLREHMRFEILERILICYV